MPISFFTIPELDDTPVYAPTSAKTVLPERKIVTDLIRAKIHSNPLPFVGEGIKLSSSIKEHAAWVYRHIYASPYRSGPRRIHGLQHVARVAIFIPVFANLYRRYHDKEALKLTSEEIELLQIAALFHDSAREDEEEDRWDQESALLLYCYLADVLHVAPTKAKQIAEAVANKDNDITDAYVELIDNKDRSITWKKMPPRRKNIYQKLIACGDCLDIMRARNHFTAIYLDFYKTIAFHNRDAFDMMAMLITEERSLLELQGDTRGLMQEDVKKKFEHERGYLEILHAINQEFHPLLHHFGRLLEGERLHVIFLDKLPFNPHDKINASNLKRAMRDGKLFARSIAAPSAIRDKRHANTIAESLAEVEIRKMLRRRNTPTWSTKPNNKTKDGNPLRSMSMIGWGASVFSQAGFLIADPSLREMDSMTSIDSISSLDTDSGRGKKSHLLKRFTFSDYKQTALTNLLRKQKMGGSSSQRSTYVATHNEIIGTIRKVDAIYYTLDPTFYASYSAPWLGDSAHHDSPILQAIYLQHVYEKQTGGIKLPILHYSGLHNRLVDREFTDRDISKMWIEMCLHYLDSEYLSSATQRLWIELCYDVMTKQLDVDAEQLVKKIIEPMEVIKVKSMYGPYPHPFGHTYAPADTHESEEVKTLITKVLHYRMGRIAAYFSNKVKEKKNNKEPSSFSPALLPNFIMSQSDKDPGLLANYFQLAEKLAIAYEDIKVFFVAWLNCSDAAYFAESVKYIITIKVTQVLFSDPDVIDSLTKRLDHLAKHAQIEKANSAAYFATILDLPFLFQDENESMAAFLLNYGINPNTLLPNKKSLLHSKVKNNDAKIVDLLLLKDANPNTEDSEGNTPLHAAVNDAHLSILLELLDHQAHLNHVNKEGETALYCATKQNEAAALLLLERGCDPNIAKKNGKIPLHEAVLNQNKVLAKALIKQGSNVNKPDNELHITPFQIAIEMGAVEILECMFASTVKPDVNLTYTASMRYLMQRAIALGRQSKVEDVFSSYKICKCLPLRVPHFTPLHAAVFAGYEWTIKMLLKNGAELAKKAAGATAFDFALAIQTTFISFLLLPAPAVTTPLQTNTLFAADDKLAKLTPTMDNNATPMIKPLGARA